MRPNFSGSHSRGTKLSVELIYARDLVVRVRDNGIGIDREIFAKGKTGHFGVLGMQERADRIGAKLRFNSTSSGTEVELIVPGNLKSVLRPVLPPTSFRTSLDTPTQMR